jgi:hypothetical protein
VHWDVQDRTPSIYGHVYAKFLYLSCAAPKVLQGYDPAFPEFAEARANWAEDRARIHRYLPEDSVSTECGRMVRDVLQRVASSVRYQARVDAARAQAAAMERLAQAAAMERLAQAARLADAGRQREALARRPRTGADAYQFYLPR